MMNIEKIIGNRNVGDILHMEHGVYFLFCGKELIKLTSTPRTKENSVTPIQPEGH